MVNPEIDFAVRQGIEAIRENTEENLKENSNSRTNIFCCITKRGAIDLSEDQSDKNKFPLLLIDINKIIYQLLQDKNLDRAVNSSGVSKNAYLERMAVIQMVSAVFASNSFAYFTFKAAKGIVLNLDKYGLRDLSREESIKKIKEINKTKVILQEKREFYKLECYTPGYKLFALYDIEGHNLVLSKDKDLEQKKFLVWESEEEITGKETKKFDTETSAYHKNAEDRLFEYASDLGKFFGTF